MRSTERTRKPWVLVLYSVMITKGLFLSFNAPEPVAIARSRIGMVAPRMFATPHTTGLDLGISVSWGHCSTSRTLKTLIPYSCWPSRRNNNSSRRFCPTSCVRWFTESITPAMPRLLHQRQVLLRRAFITNRHGACFFNRYEHRTDIFSTPDHTLPQIARRAGGCLPVQRWQPCPC